MTHTEAIDYLSEHLGYSKVGIRRLLGHTTDVLKQLLDQDRTIILPRLGTIYTKKREKRRGFHPIRRQYMMLPPRHVVLFHAGSSLRRYVKDMRV